MSDATHAVIRQLRSTQKHYARPLVLTIAPGEKGTRDTLEAMAAVVDDAQHSPAVQQVAATLAAAAPNRDIPAQLRGLDEFCRRCLNFKPDSWSMETIRHPDQLLHEIATNGRAGCDCDDVATLGASIIRALGHQPFFCACRRRAGGPFVHVHFGLFLAQGRMIPMDPQERVPLGSWTARQELRLIVPAAKR